MSTRIHSKLTMAIAAAAMIAAAVVPCASADSAKGTRIQIPPALSHVQEPGSTGWVPQSSSKPVDPLAVGDLMGQGLSPSEVTSWTTGACSHRVKAASCFAMFRSPATGAGDLARGDALNKRYHLGKYSPAVQAGPMPEGVTAQQWQAELSRGDALNQRYGLGAYAGTAHTSAATPPAPVRTVNVAAGGFDWGAAAIGAGVALGLALVSAGALMAVRKRRTLAHA